MGTNCLDYSTLAVSSSAVGLSSASPTLAVVSLLKARAFGAVMTVETDQVRYRMDGTDPTSTEGHLLNAGDILTFDSWSQGINWRSVLNKIRFIRVSSDAAIKISWFD